MNDRAPKGMGPYQVKERTKGGRKVWRITYTETVRDEDGNAILNIESGQPVRKYIRAEVARERFGSAERAFPYLQKKLQDKIAAYRRGELPDKQIPTFGSGMTP